MNILIVSLFYFFACNKAEPINYGKISVNTAGNDNNGQ